MKKFMALAVAAALIPASAVMAQPAPKKAGIEATGYQWNKMDGKTAEALKLKGDAANGEEEYEVCGACHLPNGAGRPDGTFPQLAGQHATVLTKQMVDIVDGLRDNPTMYPFAKEALKHPQAVADTSAYIETLCIPTDHGKYEGADAATQIAKGKELYEKQCVECHGKNGEGDPYYTDGDIHLAVLSEGAAPVSTPPVTQPDSALVQGKNQIWALLESLLSPDPAQ